MAEVIDARWIEEYRNLASYPNLIDSKLRAEDPDSRREEFVESNFTANPDLTPLVDLDKVKQNETSLLAFRDRIIDEEEEPVVVSAYIPRIDELLVNLKILRAAGTGDQDNYIEANIEAFGEPNRLVFQNGVRTMRDTALEAFDDPRQHIRERARVVLGILPDDPMGGELIYPDQFLAVKELYGDVVKQIYVAAGELPELLKGEMARNNLQAIVDHWGFDYTVVPQKSGLSTMSVDHGKKLIKLPQSEEYTKERFIGLAIHEIYTHVGERINGELQPLRILYSGLDRYLKAGEGKGVVAEQIVYGSLGEFLKTTRATDISRRHLAIGFARGLDDSEEKDFVGVFQRINAIDNLLAAIQDPANPEVAAERALYKTWELLAMRTQKGVVGRGMASFKDKIYAEGSPEQLQFMAKHPEVFPYMNLGKYDLTNPRHVSILRTAGILPAHIL